MAVTSYWEGGYSCRIVARDKFELRADEPPDEGGADTGPRPTELLLAALASCFTMALAYVARKRGVELPRDLAVTAVGEYAGPRFRRMRVEASCSLPPAHLERLVRDAVPYCWVSNTIKGAPELEFAAAESLSEAVSEAASQKFCPK
ncbi:MAG TPA: OsmC family protein [Candidatus Dormibacteraeota bacterium]|nr:OsmC family protein [Candidatus Dormibacteraeota bacterium]